MRAAIRSSIGILLLVFVVFAPANTLDWPRGWVYLGALLAPLVAGMVWLLARHPMLLERRMRAREARPTQRRAIAGMGMGMLLLYVTPGLGHRFGVPELPVAVSYAADVGVVLSQLLVLWVYATNEYASRVVEIERGQRVIDTGPYAWVRHPMYTAVLGILSLIPIALGSLYALVFVLPIPIGLWFRAKDEEALLLQELPGYAEYTRRVRWRFVPGVL